MGVAEGDEEIFRRLNLIFPALGGWVPTGRDIEREAEGALSYNAFTRPEEARYELAQSVLLFNTSGGFSDANLRDAALYNVACIGTSKSAVQKALWPELVAESHEDALALARMLLTNSARLRSLASRGRAACRAQYPANEEDSAVWIRQIHSSKSPYAMTGTR